MIHSLSLYSLIINLKTENFRLYPEQVYAVVSTGTLYVIKYNAFNYHQKSFEEENFNLHCNILHSVTARLFLCDLKNNIETNI